MAITLEQAKTLKRGTVLNYTMSKNSDGSPARFRVTSIMTWKTRPEEVIIRVKRGLREYHRFNETFLEDLSIEREVT